MVPCGDPDVLADFLADGCSARRVPALHGPRGHRRGGALPVDRPVRAVPPALSARRVGRPRAAPTTSGSPSTARPTRPGSTGVALVPLPTSTSRAAAEAEHAAALGLPGVMVRPEPLYGRDLGDRAYDPLYDALEEHELVLVGARGARRAGPDDRPRPLRDVRAAPRDEPPDGADGRDGEPDAAGRARAPPALRVAFLESGTGWLPYWLARLDGHAEWMADTETPGLTLTPVGVLRAPVRDLHRPRRPARGVGRRRRSAPTT